MSILDIVKTLFLLLFAIIKLINIVKIYVAAFSVPICLKI